MRKRGPAPTPLSELMFWEALWYSVFLGLCGRNPTPEEALVRGHDAAQLREELEAIKKSLGDLPGHEKVVVEDYAARTEHQIKVELAFRQEAELAEPEVWKTLVLARTPDKVRQACRQSKRWLNPKWGGRIFVQLLSEKAEQFVRAKRDPFYPRAPLASSDPKRVVFFARAMSGIECGISPSTAVGLLRKAKHGPECPCVNCNVETHGRLYKLVYKELQEEKKHPARARAGPDKMKAERASGSRAAGTAQQRKKRLKG